MENFTYALRCTIQPGFFEEERLTKILAFAIKARIREVTFFMNCEDLNNGHLTYEETNQWLATLSRCKKACEEAGLLFSINPWTTLHHGDNGRFLKPGQDFATMVDMEGNRAKVVACPLDETFIQYLENTFALYAALHPATLWIEDDFRLHGHAPLTWGGCFCERHMEEYSKHLGRKITREDFYRRLLSGEGDCRKAFLDVSRSTMVHLAKRLARKVKEVSPEAKIGLMCSNPIVHALEGRDWKGILEALGHDAVLRPHLPAYEEISAKDYVWQFCYASRLNAALVEPLDTALWPELENYPYSYFSKSKRFTRMQILLSLALNARGITLNILDMLGNGVRKEEDLNEMLLEIKPFLDRFAGVLPTTSQQGVLIPVCETAAYTIQKEDAKRMEDLYPGETYFVSLLSVYGIANRITPEYPQGEGKVVAIAGQYFRNLTPGQIEALFQQNRILMDGEAALTLFQMGLGHLAKIRNAHVDEREGRAYEEFTGNLLGVSCPRVTHEHYTCGKYIPIDYEEGVRILSKVHAFTGEVMGNGLAQAGEVLILPQMAGFRQSYMHLNPYYMEAVKQFLRGKVAMLEGSNHVMLLDYSLPGRRLLLAANCTTDDLPSLKLSGLFPAQETAGKKDLLGTGLPDGAVGKVLCYSTAFPEGKEVALEKTEEGMFEIQEELLSMDVKLFAFLENE